MTSELDGDERVALVTGAAGGIGVALVRRLLAGGTRVVAVDRDPEALGRLADGLSASVGGPTTLRCEALDVSRANDVEALVTLVEREWGPIEWGVNVAGVLETGTVVETEEAAWQRVFEVNATGVFLVSRALARRMLPRRRGAIVTVGSNAGGIPRHGMAAYAASKAAASHFTRSLGLELAPYGVRCNVVAPGSTRTPMQDAFMARTGREATVLSGSLETFRSGIPLGRIAEPEDVADAVLFLLSDQARHITMSELYVDGGASLRG